MKLRAVVFYLCLVFVATVLMRVQKPIMNDSVSNKLENTGIRELAKLRVVETYGNLPLSFEANQGQIDSEVKFLSRGSGYSLFLTSTEAVLSLKKPRNQHHDRNRAEARPLAHARGPNWLPEPFVNFADKKPEKGAVLRMKLVGANPSPQVNGVNELPGNSNYFIGNDPSKWRTNVPTFAKVRYENVYSGIDLVYYGNRRQLEYDFVIAPGADPRAIRLAIGEEEKLRVDSQGDLVLGADESELRLHQPIIYQEIRGARQRVAGNFVIQGKREVGFEVARYDSSKPLTIDPVLVYSTYLGDSSDDFADGIAVDSSGNAYVVGSTGSTNFPIANAFQPALGNDGPYKGTAFISKFNPSGSALVYSTYLGGSGNDSGTAIAVDSAGNAYVTGWTQSSNFPTANAFQPAHGGGSDPSDAFVTKLDAAGSGLVFSTYLGGSGNDEGRGIAVDSSGNAHVTGRTTSTNFPTANVFQAAIGGGPDAFVTKFDAAGSGLVFSTYLGGSSNDEGRGIAVDSSGNAYVAGSTGSTNFPTANAFQAAIGGGPDAFVTKFDAAGSGLVFSTYLGGSSNDEGRGIAVDSSGNAYVTGFTGSTNFPTANAFQAAIGGSGDAFVTKLNAVGSELEYSTFLGGSRGDGGSGIAVDVSGNAYVAVSTGSTDFPTANAFQAANGGSANAIVTKLNPSGSALVYSTYLGGSIGDTSSGIAVDSSGNAYVVGFTQSRNFPTANAIQAAYRGGDYLGDAFVTKISQLADTPPTIGLSPTSLSFTGTQGGVSPGYQTVSIANTGGGTFVWTATASTTSGATWLILSPASETVPSTLTAPSTLTVSASTAGLAVGTYNGSIVLAATGASNTPQTVAVTLTVSPTLSDLTISMTDSPDPVLSGEVISYDIAVSEIGSGSAENVMVTDSLPAGVTFVSCTNSFGVSCTESGGTVTASLGTLAAGASAVITIAATAPTVSGRTFVSNTATVSKISPEGTILNNQVSATTTVYSSGFIPPGGGPSGGTVQSIAIDPRSPNTVYAGVFFGTIDSSLRVLKSTNGGASWTVTNSGLPAAGSYALTIDPSTPATLYAAGGGVFKSSNGGTTWTATATLSCSARTVAIDPSNPATLYASGGRGVCKSTNGGTSWNTVNSGLSNTNVLALTIDPSNPSTLYAGIVGGVFKSTNGGASWTAVNSGLPNADSGFTLIQALAIDPSTPATLYAGTSDGGVFKTTNGGTSWTAVNSGLTAIGVSALAIDPSNPSTLYAGIVGGVFKSTNGGASWTAVNSGLTPFNVHVLVVDPSTPATLYAGVATYGSGVFKSTNGGTSWTAVNSGLTNATILALAIDPSKPTTLYAGTFGGAFKSTNGGASWTAINSGLAATDVYALAIDPSNPATVYAGSNVGVFKSTNGGTSWTVANSGLGNRTVLALAIDPSTPTTLYAASGGIFKSTNGGASWTAANSGLGNGTVLALAIDPSAPATLYAGSGGVFKSTNGGASWTYVGSGFPFGTLVTALAIDPSAHATLYAGVDDLAFGVFKSTDGGASWTLFDGGLPKLKPVGALAIDPSAPATLYAASTTFGFRSQDVINSGIFKSINGAVSWQPTGSSGGNGSPSATGIAKVSGDKQNGGVGQTLRYPLVLVVTNASGIPVAGTTVTFAVSAGTGSLSGTQATTDSQGLAFTILTLGTAPGTNTVTASAAGLSGSPVAFDASGAPSSLTLFIHLSK